MRRASYAKRHLAGLLGDTEEGAVEQRALDRSDVVDVALRYILLTVFRMLRTLVENSQMYRLKEEEPSEWTEVTKCLWETGILPVLLCRLHLRLLTQYWAINALPPSSLCL